MMSAAASLGLVLLWDVDGGLTQIDKYLYSPEDQIKVGSISIINMFLGFLASYNYCSSFSYTPLRTPYIGSNKGRGWPGVFIV